MTPARAAPKRAKPPDQAPPEGSRSRVPGYVWIVAAIPVGLLAILVVAWAVDAALNSGNVARNVTVVGVDVGGMDEAELDDALAQLADTYADTPVIITTADGSVQTTAGVVGLELDAEATATEVMAVGRGSAVTRPFSWLAGLVGERSAEAVVALGDGDPDALADAVNAGQPVPAEPEIVVRDGTFTVVPGQSVQVFDLSTIRDDAVAAARAGHNPIEVTAGSLELLPKRTDAEAMARAEALNALTSAGIRVTAGTQSAVFEAAELRSWLRIDDTGDEPVLTIDDETTMTALEAAFETITTSGDESPKVVVVDGEVELENFSAQACCADDSSERVLAALEDGRSSVTLDLVDVSGQEDEILAEIGIVELIGEATTPHDCCQSRVTNIQLFADLIRGVIIEPGESLSLNEHVGPRTTEKGFVESGVIYRGRLQTDVGGGISQFATTIFQAMFFAGLDIDKYFPHTLWFSRYADREGRRGIESTISYPEPDVQFTNNTPYPVLVWPTYTDTSLTVSLYSTKWVEADVEGQDIYSSNLCTVIDTDRIRRYPDGTEEIDSFQAIYQPGDNMDCNGNPTDPTTVTPEPEKTPKKKKKKAADEPAADEEPPAEEPAPTEPPSEEPPPEPAPTEPPAEEPPPEDTPPPDEDAGL